MIYIPSGLISPNPIQMKYCLHSWRFFIHIQTENDKIKKTYELYGELDFAIYKIERTHTGNAQKTKLSPLIDKNDGHIYTEGLDPNWSNQKSFILAYKWHQFLSSFPPNDRLSQISRQL